MKYRHVWASRDAARYRSAASRRSGRSSGCIAYPTAGSSPARSTSGAEPGSSGGSSASAMVTGTRLLFW